MSRRLIAITGAGAVSPFGLGVDALQRGLLEARSGLGLLSLFKSPLDYTPPVGQINEPCDEGSFRVSRMSRTERLAVAAAAEAFNSMREPLARWRDCAIVASTTVAGLSEIEPVVVADPAAYYRQRQLGRVATYPVGRVADAVARSLGIGGIRIGLSVACASGAMALITGARLILDGYARRAIVGGSDALSKFTLAGFNSLQALDREPCRPFDETRNGLNLGEAAAMLVIEDLDEAVARGAEVLAVLRGWSMTNDAFHPTAPDEQGRGLAACIKGAMKMAGVDADCIGYVNAHGTGTRLNDVAELRAYERVFADRTDRVPVSSTKAAVGHTLGAAGALEALVTLISLRTDCLFPTLQLANPLESGVVDWLMGVPRRQRIELAMSVSAGFGGSNAALIFGRHDERA